MGSARIAAAEWSMIVSTRITEGCEAPAHESGGWLDLRGDLHLEAQGLHRCAGDSIEPRWTS